MDPLFSYMVYLLIHFHVENYCGGNRKKWIGAFSTRWKYKFKGRGEYGERNREDGEEKS